MNNWQTANLGELGEFKNGANFTRYDFGVGCPIINVKNLYDGRFVSINDLDELKPNALPNLGIVLVQKNDILFARSSVKASGAGQVAMVDQYRSNTIFSGFIIRFRITKNKLIDALYLNYLLRSSEFRELLTRIANGTTITNLSQDTLSRLLIRLPPLNEQRAIAGILGALDDKIELNRRMNTKLESMARAVFRQWFVDGEDVANWEEKPLDEIANFLNGLALQKFPAEGDDYLPVIKISQLRTNDTKDADKASPNIPPEYIIEDGDILFSWSGSLVVVAWCGGRGALNQHLFKVTSKKYPKWFYYYWTKHHLADFQEIAAGKATTMGHIQRHHLKAAKVLVPSDKELKEMDKVMSPLLDKIVVNNLESRTLGSLRDSLLPKLMRGEIRLKS